MYILISLKYPVEFVYLVCNFIELQLAGQFNYKKFLKLEDYINTAVLTGKRKLTAKQLILIGSKNLIVRKTTQNYIIEFDKTTIIPYYNELKLVQLLELVNYGNLSVQGTYYISNIMKQVNRILDKLYCMYLKGGF